jgi:hypothetical protein
VSGEALLRSAVLLSLLLGALRPFASPANEARVRAPGDDPEAALTRAIAAIGQNHASAALGELDRLIAERPNFRLAHLVRGDLLLARVRPIEGLGNTGHAARGRLAELRAVGARECALTAKRRATVQCRAT